MSVDGVVDRETEGTPTFIVSDHKTANWVVRKIVEAREHAERAKRWAAEEAARSVQDERRLLYLYGKQLEAWAAAELLRVKGRRKSVYLPDGRIGFRTRPTALDLHDAAAVVQWAKRFCPGAVVVTESVNRTILHRHFCETGEVPNGSTVLPETEKFYVA
jgi:phage host-nuclease inhibitor protein Gam